MSVPRIINDGDFTAELQNGGITLSSPLADKGEFDHIVMRRKMRVDVAYFKPSNRTSLDAVSIPTADGVKTLYLVGMTDPDSPGNNLVEWEEIYANLPGTWTEPTSVTYSQQYLWYQANADQSTTISIVEFTRKRDATITHEYFYKNNPLPVLNMPKLEQFGNRILTFGGWRAFDDGELVLVEDSTSERYLGDIFVRKSVRVPWIKGFPYTPPPQPGSGSL